ncbi:MAG: hypothetical protein JW927_12045 [Deltaproteobacteria bacterium]|nr:hypothetical protein [Deltaproteobacteria bacterium]
MIFLSLLEVNNITYIVTGSVASIIYGEPRLTHDIDLVIELDTKDAQKIVDAFPDDKFYCPPIEVIKLEIRRPFRGHFNLIHHESGFKADIYLSGKDFLHKWAIENRKRYKLGNCDIWVAPPEYVILRKLEYFKEGKSDKHLTDIKNILEISGDLIDFDTLLDMITDHNLDAEWGLINPC